MFVAEQSPLPSTSSSDTPLKSVGLKAKTNGLAGLENLCRQRLQKRIETQTGPYSLNSEEVANVEQLDHSFVKGVKLSSADSDDLRSLASLSRFKLRPPSQISSHRKFIGPIIVFLKKATFPLISFHMKDTVRELDQFAGALVERQARTLSELATLRDSQK